MGYVIDDLKQIALETNYFVLTDRTFTRWEDIRTFPGCICLNIFSYVSFIKLQRLFISSRTTKQSSKSWNGRTVASETACRLRWGRENTRANVIIIKKSFEVPRFKRVRPCSTFKPSEVKCLGGIKMLCWKNKIKWHTCLSEVSIYDKIENWA